MLNDSVIHIRDNVVLERSHSLQLLMVVWKHVSLLATVEEAAKCYDQQLNL